MDERPELPLWAKRIFSTKLTRKHSACANFYLYISLTCACIVAGVLLIRESPNTIVARVDYTDCVADQRGFCRFNDVLSKTNIRGPFQVYYQLNNFHQNIKDYISSRNWKQLKGKYVDSATAEKSCGLFTTNEQMGVNVSWNNSKIESKSISSPCGLMAKQYFRDSIALILNGETVTLVNSEITANWTARTPRSHEQQWIDPQSWPFQVWMKNSIANPLKKYYGTLKSNLKDSDTLSFRVKQRTYYQSQVRKSIVIQKINTDYGDSKRLATMMFVGGTILALAAAIELVYRHYDLKQRQQQLEGKVQSES